MPPRWTLRAVLLGIVPTIAIAGPSAHAANGAQALDERFCFDLASPHFELWAETALPLQSLIGVAEDTRQRTRNWLGVAADDDTVKTRIYFVQSVESLYAIEECNGLASSRNQHETRSFHGRCYGELGLIVIADGNGSSLRWQVAHEVTHTVFHEIVRRNVEIVNEGLAELLPYWILGTDVDTPAVLDAQYEFYDRRVGQAVLARAVPAFDAFLQADTDTFYDVRAQWLWYALSWKLSKVLVEGMDPEGLGLYRGFLDELGRGRPVWSALRAVYDVDAVESAWLDAIESAAPWRPLFGDWHTEPNVIVGSVAGPHSACATLSPPMSGRAAFDIAFSLDQPPMPGLAFGFALEVRSEEDFVYVEFRPGCSSVAIAERRAGHWSQVDEYEIPPERRPAFDQGGPSPRISLHATGDGRLSLRVDGHAVLQHGLGRDLAGGALGVMFERCGAGTSDFERAEVRFRDVRVLR